MHFRVIDLRLRQKRLDHLGLRTFCPAHVNRADVIFMRIDVWPSQQLELGFEFRSVTAELEIPLVGDLLELDIANHFARPRVSDGHVGVMACVQGERQGHAYEQIFQVVEVNVMGLKVGRRGLIYRHEDPLWRFRRNPERRI